MDKQEQAQRFAEILLSEKGVTYEPSNLARTAWQYADAMQAEADKRKSKPELPSLQQTFIDGVEQPRYAHGGEEWQPDWSQAPALTTRWSVHSNGSAKWHISHGSMTIPAPLFGYTGNWQDSLRKRPQ